ncbi:MULTISPECIES: flagellar hook-basal body protein [Bacillaceae]|uniref:flagellar hook-basal body protein n=1 Tax=Bacillaceae TaxID=186817 RepID=UPI001E35B2A8|nr:MULTISPECIES: flagellar hook-basal body protein [Bacillaceae]MCE4049674.1 flagellar hook-basal body protein [Bacillus sp. Au-Bac7]MCM3031844.1 flagellar hook-basal body protein [Niallia sp. MER 6]MDL0436953.1 flagellar hook-basal body protein [Niallia sp. SS-2023]UPO87444.1 flagellar hook-basal body protein [Niallia sp. Man26]
MNRTMLIATNTLTQLQKQMDTISNNMANVDTTGYKKNNATFTDLLVQQVNNQKDLAQEVNRQTPNGIRQGNGAMVAQTQTVMTQGTLKTTNRPLDTAFTSEGQLYRVLVQNGQNTEVQYTRDGAFYLSPVSNTENMLVTKQGYAVLDENNNPIMLDKNVSQYTLSETGTLSATLNNGQTQNVNLGVTAVNYPQFLEKKGDNLYGLPANLDELNMTRDQVLTDLDGALRGEVSVQQNVLEQSNVDMSKEMVNLMSTQRSYQFQSRAITIADQMMGLVNEIR